MCGRFTQTQSAESVATTFQLQDVPPLEPRYNIAPTQAIAAVVINPQAATRQLKWFQWGLIPSWAKDASIGNKLINARAETVEEKPSFRNAFRKRRCLIVTDGFYEWQRQAKIKQPFYIHRCDRQPFAFAGLWEYWQGSDGSEIESCTILTTEANDLMQPIHHRMPVILQSANYDTWLDPQLQDAASLKPLLQPYAPPELEAYAISTAVNRPSHDQPDCIQPLVEA